MILYKKPRYLCNKAFSLIEVVLVSLIIIVLVLVAFYYYKINMEYARMAVFIQNFRFVKIATEKYYLDKGRYPDSFWDLFSDPYRDYLPRSLASSFIYSPWNGDIFIKKLGKFYYTMLLLYVEYRFSGKNMIPPIIINKIKKELYFYGCYSIGKKDYLIFLLSFAKK